MRQVIAVIGFATMLFTLGGATPTSAGDSEPRVRASGPDHVFVIMMENTGYDHLIGDANAPWINSAAQKYGLATQYFGVIHPSQPNYVAATSGVLGKDSDDDETLPVPNIVDQLESHAKTWTAYMQSYSLCSTPTAHACGNQLYERKHNPFISYDDVRNSPARVANIVDLTKLDADLAANTVANYVWISPDQCSDMHGRAAPKTDPCSFSNEELLVSAGDSFLSTWTGKIMSSRAWTSNSVIVIAWDESDFTNSGPFGFGDTSGCCDANPGGGHVLALVINRSDQGGGQSDPDTRTSNVPYNHFSLLRTIQEAWGLGCLGATCDTANVPAMNDLVGPGN